MLKCVNLQENKFKKILAVVIGIGIIMNFIPIKFAIHLGDPIKNVEKDELCIIRFAESSEGTYSSIKINNEGYEDYKSFMEVTGNSPFRSLNKDFKEDNVDELVGNKYIVLGRSYNSNLYPKTKYSNSIVTDNNANYFEIDKWEIVYPIKRNGWRVLFSPKGYLNVYDYDWKVFFFGKRI